MNGGAAPANQPDHPPAPTPATWGEYFTLWAEAVQANREAQDAFGVAGKRLSACSDRLASLETWANAAEKVAPYSGFHDDDNQVDVNGGES